MKIDTATRCCYHTFIAAAQNNLIEAESRVFLCARNAEDEVRVTGVVTVIS